MQLLFRLLIVCKAAGMSEYKDDSKHSAHGMYEQCMQLHVQTIMAEYQTEARLLLPAGVLCYLRCAVFGTVNGDHVWDICICSVPPVTADTFCALTV